MERRIYDIETIDSLKFRAKNIRVKEYLMVCNKTNRNKTVAIICAHREINECPAKGKYDPANKFVIMHEDHNHYGDLDAINVQRTVAQIKKRVVENPTVEICKLFDDTVAEMNILYPGIRDHISPEEINSCLQKLRRLHLPPIPQTMKELGEALDSNPILSKMIKENPNDPDEIPKCFYNTTITEGNTTTLLFVNPEIENLLQNAEDVFIDSTFKTCPKRPQIKQMHTWHVKVNGHFFPIIYSLMSHKTQQAYTTLFQHLKNNVFGGWLPRNVMMDYERACQNALKHVFPEVQLHGCWFHYAQSLWRKVLMLGGIVQLLNNGNPQLRKSLWKIISMLMALPLLPADRIKEGFEVIKKLLELHPNKQELEPFLDYVNSTWMKDDVIPVICVHNLKDRTNNAVESFNRTCNKMIGQNRNIWVFLDKLKALDFKCRTKYRLVLNGHKIRRPPKKCYLINNKRIEAATKEFEYTKNVSQFLNRSSYCIGNNFKGLKLPTPSEQAESDEDDLDFTLMCNEDDIVNLSEPLIVPTCSRNHEDIEQPTALAETIPVPTHITTTQPLNYATTTQVPTFLSTRQSSNNATTIQPFTAAATIRVPTNVSTRQTHTHAATIQPTVASTKSIRTICATTTPVPTSSTSTGSYTVIARRRGAHQPTNAVSTVKLTSPSIPSHPSTILTPPHTPVNTIKSKTLGRNGERNFSMNAAKTPMTPPATPKSYPTPLELTKGSKQLTTSTISITSVKPKPTLSTSQTPPKKITFEMASTICSPSESTILQTPPLTPMPIIKPSPLTTTTTLFSTSPLSPSLPVTTTALKFVKFRTVTDNSGSSNNSPTTTNQTMRILKITSAPQNNKSIKHELCNNSKVTIKKAQTSASKPPKIIKIVDGTPSDKTTSLSSAISNNKKKLNINALSLELEPASRATSTINEQINIFGTPKADKKIRTEISLPRAKNTPFIKSTLREQTIKITANSILLNNEGNKRSTEKELSTPFDTITSTGEYKRNNYLTKTTNITTSEIVNDKSIPKVIATGSQHKYLKTQASSATVTSPPSTSVNTANKYATNISFSKSLSASTSPVLENYCEAPIPTENISRKRKAKDVQTSLTQPSRSRQKKSRIGSRIEQGTALLAPSTSTRRCTVSPTPIEMLRLCRMILEPTVLPQREPDPVNDSFWNIIPSPIDYDAPYDPQNDYLRIIRLEDDPNDYVVPPQPGDAITIDPEPETIPPEPDEDVNTRCGLCFQHKAVYKSTNCEHVLYCPYCVRKYISTGFKKCCICDRQISHMVLAEP